jgi:prefoldin subunit 5
MSYNMDEAEELREQLQAIREQIDQLQRIRDQQGQNWFIFKQAADDIEKLEGLAVDIGAKINQLLNG